MANVNNAAVNMNVVQPPNDAAIDALARQAATFSTHPGSDSERKAQHDSCYSKIIRSSKGCNIVCMGESTHGTTEFYEFRAELTKRLLAEGNFRIVLVESNWPDAYRVGQYTGTEGSFDSSANEASAGFDEFPKWMWRNAPVFDFVNWMKEHNKTNISANAQSKEVKFMGVDLYSLYRSQEQLLAFLDTYDREAKVEVEQRFQCFAGRGNDSQVYGQWAASLPEERIQRIQGDLERTMAEMQQRAGEYMLYGASSDACLNAIENAASIVSAEEYYRKQYTGDQVGWNTRDQHMAQTVLRLTSHFTQQDGTPPGIIIWAHNSHVGDCSATETGSRGEWNLGLMLRRTFSPSNVYNIGLGTHTGTVTAADKWGGDCKKYDLSPAIDDTYDEILHRVALRHAELTQRDGERKPSDLAFIFREEAVSEGKIQTPPAPSSAALLMGPFLERMVGVNYIKHNERQSHYVQCSLPRQFDAWVHFDSTTAVVPQDGWPKPSSLPATSN